MALDYKKCASEIYGALGGEENLIKVSHCATRLRFKIKESGKVKKEELEAINGVQGVMERKGDLQIIIGTGAVNKVYHEFQKMVRLAKKEEIEEKSGRIRDIPEKLIRTIGEIFIPILPAIVAAGLIMGLVEAFGRLIPSYNESDIFNWMRLVSNTSLTYLPVLVAISSANVFGGNVFLGATVGMLLMHMDLMPSTAAAVQPGLVQYWDILGFQIRQVNYQGHVIPVIIAIWFMCKTEKWLHRRVPEMIDIFVTPLVTVLTTAFLTMAVIGPFFIMVEGYILDLTQYLLRLPAGIGAFFCGVIYPLTVVFGIHHMFEVLQAGMLVETGKNIWIPISCSANFAMSMACMAVCIKTKRKDVKATAFPAALSAALGITEPAIFGINLRFFIPLVCGVIAAGIGAAVGTMMGVYGTSYGVTGIPGMLITLDCAKEYLLMLAVAGSIAFGLTFLFWQERENEDTTVFAPLSGKIVPQEEIPDETFAQGLVGKGVGIIPERGEITAPFDGVVTMTTPGGHAVALRGPHNMSVLIHVGIDTVELDGEGFQLCVRTGDQVKAGQKLLIADLEKLEQQGYQAMTLVFLTNNREFADVKVTGAEWVKAGESLITVEEASDS